LPAGNSLFKGSGKFVSMKVDKNNGIHIAFYNNIYSNVVYYYAASRDDIGKTPVTTATGSPRVHTVDNVIKGGTWTDISVDNSGNPYIVYGDIINTGNYEGARMAYRSGSTTGVQFARAQRCPVTNTDTAGWEAMTMASNYKVNEDRLNIEAWPPTVRGGTLGTRPTADTWNVAIGYASDLYRIGYFYYPQYKDGSY
jgi:hypothetical protein